MSPLPLVWIFLTRDGRLQHQAQVDLDPAQAARADARRVVRVPPAVVQRREAEPMGGRPRRLCPHLCR